MMMRSFLRSKIHRVKVTEADLNYEGSLSIDRLLMNAADIAPYEEIQVWNVTRPTRLSTYVIEAPAGSGTICANGGAAHFIEPGDLIIISAFQWASSPQLAAPPIIVRVDENNRLLGDDLR